jgi:hypothetical protein
MEIIRKPQATATEMISIRVTAGLKKEYARARDLAQRQGIDLTAMVSNAVTEVCKAITQTSNKVSAIS